MIECKDDESPYSLFSAFVFEWIEVIVSGDIDRAEAMIDEVNPMYDGAFRERIEMSNEMDGEFSRADEEKTFALNFYKPGRDLGNDYTVEFYIPNDALELDTALEFQKVDGGFKVVFVRF